MPTSVRLDPPTEAELERIARLRDLSKSDVIREAIHAYGAALSKPTSLLEAWAPWIGSIQSGDGTLSEDAGRKARQKFLQRHGSSSRTPRRS